MLSVLEDLIPAKYRKYVVYILIPFFVLLYGIYQSVHGDWTAFWPALVPAIIGWLVAAPNTHPSADAVEVPTFESTDAVPGLDAQQPDPAAPTVVPSAEAIAAATDNAVGDTTISPVAPVIDPTTPGA